jgi:hypothetical protein
MRRLSAKWVPKCLNAIQKGDLVLASQGILDRFRRDSVGFLNRIVTMDETWIYIYMFCRIKPPRNDESRVKVRAHETVSFQPPEARVKTVWEIIKKFITH